MTALVEAAEAFFCRLGTWSIVMMSRKSLNMYVWKIQVLYDTRILDNDLICEAERESKRINNQGLYVPSSGYYRD